MASEIPEWFRNRECSACDEPCHEHGYPDCGSLLREWRKFYKEAKEATWNNNKSSESYFLETSKKVVSRFELIDLD